MNIALWLRFAARDLRSGLQGFWIFLACLALGTAGIAMVGSLAAAISRGLTEQGQPLLGGDIEFALIHREAAPAELQFITSQGAISKTATLRAMAIATNDSVLVEAKAVDGNYPLYGQLQLTEGGDRARLLAESNGAYGAVADPLLMGRLHLNPGDSVRVGAATIAIRGTIASEPDRISDGFALGPRLLMSEDALNATGLIQPGSLITWHYRVKLEGDASSHRMKQIIAKAKAEFPDAGWRLRTRDNAAQGTERFVERLGYFMTLVGLTSLIVGGAGIANAVRGFVNRRTASIATFKCLGASSLDVFGIYLTEILSVALIAIALGLAAGAVTPVFANQLLSGLLPLPIAASVEVKPLLIAGTMALLVTFAFALWPLGLARRVRASALFRHRALPVGGVPGPGVLAGVALALTAIAALAFASFNEPRITAWYLAGLAASFVALMVLARVIVWAASLLPRPPSVLWRQAIANIHRPGSASASVILALGLGLTLFVTLALTDRAISDEFRSGIPDKAPAFFFLDVRNDELARFMEAVKQEKGVTEVTSAPTLRGRIVAVKGVPVDKVKADADAGWALRGDRGLTYSDSVPKGSTLTEGEWWPADYQGPPLVSLASDVGHGIGVKIGDEITVNVLGREVTAKIASFREVNWRSLGLNFAMVFSPSTLKDAPHANVVTVAMAGGDEAQLVNGMAKAFPTATALRVKDALSIIGDLLGKMLSAIRGANLVTLLTGLLVLAGALTAGLSERLYDSVVLKTYGATRGQLMGTLVIEYAGLGLAAAGFGILTGSLASWFLARFILQMPWHFSSATAILTALIAMAVTVAAGLAVTWSALSARPAAYLRNE